MYTIIKAFNGETLLAENDGRLFVLKRITLDEVDIVKKLMTVNSENVVKFYGTAVIDNNFYAVEEYINGITLKEYIEKRGLMNDTDAQNVALAICCGLRGVHRLGIVHRDINPNNIMLDSRGVVKIIDFGISRTYKPKSTADTQILGTQGYAAPEQYGFSQTGSAADIYSLGVLINYMKTGCLPNQKRAQGKLGKIAEKCTRIDVNDRYGSVDEVMNEILYGSSAGQSVIPGFRHNVKWHKWVASAYYIFCFIAVFAYLCPSENDSVSNRVFFICLIIFVLVVPVFIIFDFMNWSNKLEFTKRLDEKTRKFVPVFTGAVYAVTAFLVFIIIDYPQ